MALSRSSRSRHDEHMEAAVVQVLLAIPITAFTLALVWTKPGPKQKRRRAIVAWSAGALLLIAVVIMVGDGILENVSETPESRESQWGTGWAILAGIIALPLVLLSVALFAVAYTTAQEMGTRVFISMAATVVIGGPLFWALAWITVVQIGERF